MLCNIWSFIGAFMFQPLWEVAGNLGFVFIQQTLDFVWEFLAFGILGCQ